MKFADFLKQERPVLFPGAMGTELQRRGFETYLPLWSAAANTERPELVTEIHRDYFAAGADIAVTNSFRTTPRTYAKIGKSRNDALDALKQSVNCARMAAGTVSDRPVFVCGSIAPLEDCYEPDLVPSDAALADEHRELVEAFRQQNVDFLLLETINSVREAEAMAKAASASGQNFIVSFVVDENGILLDGHSLNDAVAVTDHPGRIAVMLNCRPIAVLSSALVKLQAVFDGPTGLYANGIGMPHPEQGWIFSDDADSIRVFTQAAKIWHAEGVQIIGGCCGTTPAYIDALKTALQK